MPFYSVLLTRIRSHCLLIDTYQYSQWYLVLLHAWKVAKALLLLCCRSAFLCAPICKGNFQLQRSFPVSHEAKNSCWSGASKIKALVYSTSFMYNGKDMRGAVCVCSLVYQMLELLDRIRIGRCTSSGKEMADAHRLLRKRDYSIEECCLVTHHKTL